MRHLHSGEWWVLAVRCTDGCWRYLRAFDAVSGKLLYYGDARVAAQFRSPSEAEVLYWAMGGTMDHIVVPQQEVVHR